MPAIVLTTINARYSHSALALRCLLANLGDLQARTVLLEFELSRPPVEIAERILAEEPAIVGLGVYIWNVTAIVELAALLKRLQPGLILIAGGPEISHETEEQPLTAIVDYVITGEADLAFHALAEAILNGHPPSGKIIHAPPPDPASLALPYAFYTDEDIARRVIYVEASRGCPFTCEFCLSSLDHRLVTFPLDRLLPAFATLLERGVREFKFLDRTFNTSPAFCLPLLRFFLERYRPGLFLHVEMVPDRVPDEVIDLLKQFPEGALQIEIGIQTFNEEVAARIKRRRPGHRVEDTIRRLRRETGAHLHTDLIVGLPGEDLASFAAGFDRLLALDPQEIQVNLLKRLRGTPIIRHAGEWGMIFSPAPPYEILRTNDIVFPVMQQLRRFARYWNLFGNSRRFTRSLPLLWSDGASPFQRLWTFFGRIHSEYGQTHKLALEFLAECLWRELTEFGRTASLTAAIAIATDYGEDGRRDPPLFLRPHLPSDFPVRNRVVGACSTRLKRQQRG